MPTLEEIAEPFEMVDRDMRIELLLEYADKLPPLPEEYETMRDNGLDMVHECQSPVFLHVEVDDNDVVHVIGDVPREAPTARAFVSILHEAFDGEPAATVESATNDPLRTLGLSKLLGMQRTQGLSAIYKKLRTEVGKKKGNAESGKGRGKETKNR
jgi:cysteine desulfuration protein SufE